MEGSRESQGDRLMPMTTISRRRFLGTVAAVAAVAAAGAPRPARGGTAVKIGTAVLGDYSMAGPVIVALERGFFAREGLEAEFVPLRGGPDLLKAVKGGDVLVGITGSTDILVFREAGSPIKMVATHTEGNHFTLNVAPDVSSVAGLKGKAIGVTRSEEHTSELQSRLHLVCRLLLEKKIPLRRLPADPLTAPLPRPGVPRRRTPARRRHHNQSGFLCDRGRCVHPRLRVRDLSGRATP